MREGIVQKLFKKWRANYKNCNCDFCRLVEPESIELEQELIEEIKQEFDNTPFVLHADYAKTIEKKLIGDTK